MTTALPAEGSNRPDAATVRRRRLLRLVTLVLAVILALLVWVISVPVAGTDLTIGSGDAAMTVALPAVVIATLVGGGVAWAVLALLERFVGRGLRVWQIVAWIVLALSMLGPVSMGAAPAVLATLIIMHIVVGVTVIIGYSAAARHRERVRR